MDKLPEWPTIEAVKKHFNGSENFHTWGAIHDVQFVALQSAYWEARCRLAVETLKALSNLHDTAPVFDTWDTCDIALAAIGPLPAPHTEARRADVPTDAVQK